MGFRLMTIMLFFTTCFFSIICEECLSRVASCYRRTLSAYEKSTKGNDQALLKCIDSENCDAAKKKTCLDFPKRDPQYLKRKWAVDQCERWGVPIPGASSSTDDY